MASTNFINECKVRANANRLGQLIVDGIDNPITQSDKLQNFTVDNGCYVDGNIIGSVYVKKLTGKILDSANVSLVDKTMQAKIGVKYADNSTEYLNIGKYTVERPKAEKTVNTSEFTAYNGLINKLDDKYVCNIDYSKENITLADLYKDVCNQMSLTPKTTTFDNSSIPISANPFTNGEKNRTALQVIAKIAGAWIEIDDDSNEVDLHWLSQNSEPDYVFNLNDYSTVEGGEITCGPINCLIIKNSQVDDENITITDDESIALYGENAIVINEDYILYNSDLRQQAINAIWNKVQGLNYVDCKLITYYGKPFLKLGDKIRIYTNETEYFDTYVLKHNFTYDGTFTSVIESPVLTKQEIKNKQNVSLGELLRNTRIDVNKQERKINLAVETAQEAYDKVEVYNPVLEAEGNGQLSLPDCAGEKLLEFTVEGKSEQETSVQGNNILGLPEGYTWTNGNLTVSIEDGVIVFNGSTTSTGYFDIPINPTKVSGDYIYALSGEGDNLDATSFTFYTADKTAIGTYNYPYADGSQRAYKLTDVDETIEYIHVWWAANLTYNNTKFYYMLNEGTEVIPFEKFIPNSLSPNYPSEIKSLDGVVNLFDKDNANILRANVNATNIASSDNAKTLYIEITGGKTYTVSKMQSARFRIGTTKEIPNINVATSNWNDDDNATKITLTTDLSAKYLCVYYFLNGTDTSTEQEILDSIMITEGSIAHGYVPYGSNYLVDKVIGKNRLNIHEKSLRIQSFTDTFEILEDDWIHFANTSGSIRTYRFKEFEVEPNTSYSVFVERKEITGASPYNIWQEFDENWNAIAISYPNSSRIITTNEKTKYVLFSITSNNQNSITDYKVRNLIVKSNTIDEVYEEYKKAISLIDLKGNKLCSNKDLTVRDLLTVKNGVASIDKKINEVVLNDSFEIGSFSTVNKKRRFKIVLTEPAKTVANNVVTKLLSDRFNAISGDDTYSEKNGICAIGDTVVIYYDAINTYTNDQFKEWLTNNPITLQYELATPQIIDLGEVSIETVQSDCTLTLEEKLDTDMYAKYIKNNPYNEAYSTRLDTKAQIQLSENKIESSVSETILQNTELMQGEIDSLSSNLENNYMTSDEVQNLNNLTNDSLAVITNEFKQIQTSTQTQFQAITSILQNGVNLVKTTYTTIDDEGIKIAKSTDSFNSTFDNRGLKLYSYTDLMAVYTNKGAGVTNLLVTGTMDLGYSKIMKVTQNGKKYTGIFYSDAMVQTLEDFVED